MIVGSPGKGGGAGGRIAVYYDGSDFTGWYKAYGGWSSLQRGGAGTVYLQRKLPAPFTRLIIDSGSPADNGDMVGAQSHTVRNLVTMSYIFIGGLMLAIDVFLHL